MLNNGAQAQELVPLVFSRNKRPRATSAWIANHNDMMVFSSRELDVFLNQQPELLRRTEDGKPILVSLKLVQPVDKPANYQAFPITIESLRESFAVPSVSTWADNGAGRISEKRRVAVFFDGQNFLWAAHGLGVFTPGRVFRLISKILSFHEVKLAKFFICWEADIGGAKISRSMRRAIESVPGLEVVARPMKVVRSNNAGLSYVKKVDVDGWLMPSLIDAYHKLPGLEGVVLVAGDSDYAPGLEATWLRQDRGGAKYVEVISSEATLAWELRDNPGITVRYLEKII